MVRSEVMPCCGDVMKRMPASANRPNSLKDAEGYKKTLAKDLGIFRHLMLEQVRGGSTGFRRKMRLWHCWRHKDELMRTLQAVRQVSQMSLADPSFYALLRSNIDAVREQALSDIDNIGKDERLSGRHTYSKLIEDQKGQSAGVVVNPIMLHHSLAVATLVEIMVTMMLISVPARYAEDTGKDRPNLHRDTTAHRCESICAVLSKPSPCDLQSGYSGWCSWIKKQDFATLEENSQLDGITVHPSWYDREDSETLPMIGYKDFAWAIGMKEIYETNGVNSNSGRKKLSAVEHVLMYSLRTLLSNLIAELEVQVDVVGNIELKFLGSIMSVVCAAFSFMYQIFGSRHVESIIKAQATSAGFLSKVTS